MLSRIERFLTVAGVFCVATMFVLTIVQVVLRYFFSQSYFFTEELARYALIWATLIGVAIESRNAGHIKIPFLAEQLKPRARKIRDVINDTLELTVFLALVVLGIASALFNHGQQSPGLQIPMSIPFLAIPIGFAFCVVFGLERFIRHWKGGA